MTIKILKLSYTLTQLLKLKIDLFQKEHGTCILVNHKVIPKQKQHTHRAKGT